MTQSILGHKFTKWSLFLMLIPLMMVFASGSTCFAQTVEVPSGHLGKVKTSAGLESGVKQPSKLKIGGNCRVCDTLIIAKTTDFR